METKGTPTTQGRWHSLPLLLASLSLAGACSVDDDDNFTFEERNEASGGAPSATTGGRATASTGGRQAGSSGGSLSSGAGSAGAPQAPDPSPCEYGFTGSTCDLRRFEGVGLLPDAGAEGWTAARAVSNDGTTVVGVTATTAAPEDSRPFLWTVEDGVQLLGERGSAVGVNGDGTVVVGSVYRSDQWRAYRWTESGGVIVLGLPDGADPSGNSYASDIDDSGTVIVGSLFSTTGSDAAVIWTPPDGAFSLEPAPGISASSVASADAISDDGQAVAGTADASAFRWTASTGMKLFTSVSSKLFSVVSGISGDGSTVVGALSDEALSTSAFRWRTTTGLTTLEVPSSCIESVALATNGDGTMVAFYCTLIETTYLWKANGRILPLDAVLEENEADITGWTGLVVEDISTDGTVLVGTGTNPDGEADGWIARISPFE